MHSAFRELSVLLALMALLILPAIQSSAISGEGHRRRIVQEGGGSGAADQTPQLPATLVEGAPSQQQATPLLFPATLFPAGGPAGGPAPLPLPSSPVPPPPPPPACPPLPSLDVVPAELAPAWEGDLNDGLTGLAIDLGGNITDLLDRQAVVVDRDPTLPAGTPDSNVIMVTYQSSMAGPQGGASFFIYPFGLDYPLGNSVRLQYKVMFEDGFDWSRGGTLPGLFQGPVSDDVDQQPCFGGWQAGQRGVNCFAIRPQWKAGGSIEFSLHIPLDSQICQFRETAKGWSNPNSAVLLFSRTTPKLEVLQWHQIDIYVQLNDVGRANGQVLLSVNGTPLLSFPRVVIRTREEQTVEAGLTGMAIDLGGNITDLLDRQAVVVDRDPTLPAGTPDSNVIMVTYQASMAGPQGGASFFIYPFGLDYPLGNSVRLQYKVMFEDGFDWSRGGTLPGLFQGPVSDDVDQQPCFGGWQAGQRGVNCFAIRPQWKANGEIEFSMHIPQNRQICQLRKVSKGWRNPNGGVLLFEPNGPRMEVLQWYLIDIFVQLNDVGRANGQVLLSVNGTPLLSFPRVVIRTREEQTVEVISFASFYLGTANTAPSREQHVLFKDLRLMAGYMESPALPSPPPPPVLPPPQLPAPAPEGVIAEQMPAPLP